MTNLPGQLLRDAAYETLQHAIITGKLAPGTILHDQEIAEQLGCSRAPVREAILRLKAESLVEIKAKSYTQVSQLDRDRAIQSIPVITVLREVALVAATPLITESEIDRLEELNAELREARDAPEPLDVAIEVNQRFHNVYTRASGNQVLVEMLDLLAPHVYRAMRLLYVDAEQTLGSVTRAADLRVELIDSLRRRDVDAAVAANRDNGEVLYDIIGRPPERR